MSGNGPRRYRTGPLFHREVVSKLQKLVIGPNPYDCTWIERPRRARQSLLACPAVSWPIYNRIGRGLEF